MLLDEYNVWWGYGMGWGYGGRVWRKGVIGVYVYGMGALWGFGGRIIKETLSQVFEVENGA